LWETLRCVRRSDSTTRISVKIRAFSVPERGGWLEKRNRASTSSGRLRHTAALSKRIDHTPPRTRGLLGRAGTRGLDESQRGRGEDASTFVSGRRRDARCPRAGRFAQRTVHVRVHVGPTVGSREHAKTSTRTPQRVLH
jgi:hypothetical protein